MFEKAKRALLRRKLKREKIKLLGELVGINKKLKKLDELDEKDEKDKKGKDVK